MEHTQTVRSPLIPGAEPFLFSRGNVGCLLIHGFSSTPYDVRSCGEYLAAHGITTQGVLLAGHGTTPEDLATTRLPDWLASIRKAHAELTKTCSVIFVLGISLGGNFTCLLASELSFDGLILVGMPLKLRHQRSYEVWYYLLRLFGKKFQRKWYQQSLDPEIRKTRPNYDRLPLANARDVLRAIERTVYILPTIRCPVLVIQSTTDHALEKGTMEKLTATLGSSDIQVQWVPNKYHVVLIDHGKEDIFRDILEFIRARTPTT